MADVLLGLDCPLARQVSDAEVQVDLQQMQMHRLLVFILRLNGVSRE